MSRDRHSSRMPGYDYSQEGAYYVTICTNLRDCVFGKVVNRSMVANEAGLILTLIDGDAERAADTAIYATAANSAIASFTKHLATTLQEHGVRVVGVTTTADDEQSARHIADVVMERTAFASGDILKISD